jgi:hypothetical protein
MSAVMQNSITVLPANVTVLRTCNELGVCQAKPIPCTGCHHWTDRHNDGTDNSTPSSFDQIAYWGSVVATGLLTLVAVCGTAGYLVARFWG